MLNKFIVLLATAMPGIQRLIIFFILAHFFSTKIMGEFSNDYYIVQSLLFFTTIGISGLVLIRVPKLKNSAEFIQKSLLTSFFFSILFILVLFILSEFNSIYFFIESSLLLLSWSLYMIIRHLFLATKEYNKILLYDILVLLFFGIGLLFNPNYIVLQLAIAYLLVNLIYLIQKFSSFKSYELLKKEDLIKSISISASNFLSGATFLILVPLINYKYGNDYAGLLGFSLALLSMLLLFPRAMSYHYLPLMSKNINEKLIFSKIYFTFQKFNFLFLITMFLLSIFMYFMLKYFMNTEVFNLESSLSIFFMFSLVIISSQIALPVSNILYVHEELNILLKINLYVFLLFLILVILFLSMDNNIINIIILLFSIFILNIIKFIFIKQNSRRYIK